MLLEQAEGLAVPLLGVLAALAHPQRPAQAFPGRQVGGDRVGVRGRPVLVEVQDAVVVQALGTGQVVEQLEAGRPVVALVGEQVVGVDPADRHGQLPVQLDQPRHQVGMLVGQGLVQQVVAGHGRLVAVPLGEHLPQADGARGLLVVREQFRQPVGGVVDVRAGLTARCPVQVEHAGDPLGPAPGDHVVHQADALREQGVGPAVLCHDQAGVDRDPYMVEPGCRDRRHVRPRDELAAVALPEPAGVVGPEQGGDHRLDRSWGDRALVDPPHVPLGQQPAAQPHAPTEGRQAGW